MRKVRGKCSIAQGIHEWEDGVVDNSMVIVVM